MRPVEPLLKDARTHYEADPDLHRVVLNATSWVEANLAVEVLAESVAERDLVRVANIREAIKELPACPAAMAIDFEGLARVWEMERDKSAWKRSFADADGEYSILLLGEGNYCYDIVVRAEGRTLMWMPPNRDDDFLNPDVIDLLVQRPAVLGSVISLVQAMGLPFYPSYYLSLEDWRQEYVQTVFDEVVDLFSTEDDVKRRARRAEEEDPHGTDVRFRGAGDDNGITWLF